MSGPATLKIEIVSDPAAAQRGLKATETGAENAERAVESLGKSFDTAADHAREFGASADSVDEVGGASAKTAGALGDLGGAFELIGGSAVGEKLGVVGTVLQAGAGIADLYTVGIQGAKAALAAMQSGAALAAAKTIALNIAQKAVAIGTGIWTAAQWLLNIALNANPIGLIVLAIAVLIGIIVLVVKNWDTLKNATIGAWNAIKNAVVSAWQWLKRNSFDPLIAIVKLVMDWFGKLRTKASEVWAGIKATFSDNIVVRTIQGIIDKVREFMNMLGSISIPSWLNPTEWFSGGSQSFAPARSGSLVFRQVLANGLQATALAGARVASQATAAATRSINSPTIVVNVILEGKKVGGYVQRVVAKAFDDEGSRLVSGSWGL